VRIKDISSWKDSKLRIDVASDGDGNLALGVFGKERGQWTNGGRKLKTTTTTEADEGCLYPPAAEVSHQGGRPGRVTVPHFATYKEPCEGNGK